MRVTQSMLTNNMLRNVSHSYNQLDKYMDQLSTGKKINRPSDDPVVAMKGISYRSELSKVNQFERNIGEVHSWMENTDEALNEVGNVLHRLRELVIQASNDVLDEDERRNIMEEVSQLTKHLQDIGNTKVNNKYIFSGTNTTEPLFLNDGSKNTNINSNEVLIEVSDGITIQSNVDPELVFSDDLFDDLNDLITSLSNGATGEDLDDFIGLIDTHSQSVINARADLGARMNRVELIEDRLSQQKVSTTKLLSNNEDADIEEVIMNLVMQESVHRAALGAGARIIQPSLLDFLR